MLHRKRPAARKLFLRTLLTLPLLACQWVHAQADLQVTYGSKGIQKLSYRGVTLEDQSVYHADTFHIWHMKATDLGGKVISTGQYGWGEVNNGESWDSLSHTEIYNFSWGRISTQFIQNGNNLDMLVTETNNAGSGIQFDGAEIYPFALHFPVDPTGFFGFSQYAITTTGPAVSVADFGSGVVTSVIPNEGLALYGGWKAAGSQTYTPLMTSTAPDGLATFLPHNDVPVQPGSSFSYTVSLRFTPGGVAANANDAYASFAATYPSQMRWTDKRIIGTAYLASSPANSDITQPGGFPTNPRRYFNDASIDVTTSIGLQAFQSRMLAQAQSNVTNAIGLESQGVITWDIEGEQFPQSTSYVCSPEQIALVAPEMETTITDRNSTYYGQKLDDAYFKTMLQAGLRIGVCIRPQMFTLATNGTASQVNLGTDAAILQNLEKKARYANSRWGATIFYVDSSVYMDGGTLNPTIFQQLITNLPDYLFIPEESTPRYYAYTAPFYSFLFHTDLGTAPSTYNVYPDAFGVNLVNDVSPGLLAAHLQPLTTSVGHGDILMGHADYWQANNPVLLQIYAAAGVRGSGPLPGTPTILWPSSTLLFGTAISSTQLNATASVPGSFVYSPPAGTLLHAGATTLQTTFTPADTKLYKDVTVTTTLTVTKAVPVLSWASPTAVKAGTALSSAQLNAVSTVPGTFTYSPGAGAVLSKGDSQLQVTFTPADSDNYTAAVASVNLVVFAAQQQVPVLTWPVPSAIIYGTPLSGLQLNSSATVAGSFTYSPAAGAILDAGIKTLRLTFSPSDSANYASVSTTSTINVLKAVPVLSWPAPDRIAQGTPLSSAQLNASSNTPGSFTYNPPAGSVLSPGTTTLQTVFTPTDPANYVTQTANVGLSVSAAEPVNARLAIVWPAAATTVSGTINVVGQVKLALDSAGTFLLVDGQQVGTRRVTDSPFVYPLDTSTLSSGPHTLQLWGHDIGNNTTLSQPVTVTVSHD